MFAVNPIVRLIARIASAIIYILTIMGAYGGHISPRLMTIPHILTLGFPYLVVLTIICILGWAIARRWIQVGIGVLTLIICWGPLSLVAPWGREREPQADEKPRFTLLTWNILHGEDVENRDSTINRTFDYILHSGADIVALQELHNFSSHEIKHLPVALKDSIFAAYPYRVTDGINDLCLLSKYPARTLRVTDKPYGSGYFYEAYRINIGDKKLTVLNVHLASYQLTEGERDFVERKKSVNGAKNSLTEFKGSIYDKLKKSFVERDKHAREIREVIEHIRGPLIICGDFNDVPASWAYYRVRGEDLRDAYTETRFGPISTYNLHHFYFHIDPILYRGDIKALSVKRGSIRSSDHYPQIATFAFLPQ